MKQIIITFCMLFAITGNAQNKVTPVSNSAITGIALPDGSKQDKRGLSVLAAKIMLEMVSKPKGTGMATTEVLYLPLSYTMDSLKAALQNANWIISPADGEKDYLWLQQKDKQVLVHFSTNKKSQDLYFGETAQAIVAAANKIDTLQVYNNNNVVNNNNTAPIQQTQADNVPVQPVVSSTGFTFTTTNWQDGWISNIKEDWVEVTKGNIKVLLHYPNKKADTYNSVLKDEDYLAWNTLVAPRYSNMTNFEWKSIQSWESIAFMQADATEIATGKNVHIVLFKKHYSTGIGRYLEFVTDSKADYENEFGPYHNTEFDWDKTANMQFRNKFSVAANDIIGKWSTTDYASISYYYVNTGGLAGTTATSTADEFTFLPGNNYESDHSGASGMVGNMKFSRQVYKGQSTVNNWDITLTNRFQGASEKFESYFESVKGGRALILKDHLNTVYTLVKQP